MFWTELRRRKRSIHWFGLEFFWGSHSCRVRDPLMSCLEALKQSAQWQFWDLCISSFLYFSSDFFLSEMFTGKYYYYHYINFKENLLLLHLSLSLPLESLFSVCDIKIFVVRMFVNSKIEEYYISQENSSKSWRTFKGALILGFDVNCFSLNKIIWWPIGLLAITSLAGMFNFPKLQWFSMKWSEITYDLNFHTKINHANISRSSGTDSLIKFFFECGSCQVGIKIN